MKRKILLVFAHPDDESFSCAGTVIHYVRNGTIVKLICATRGEAGTIGEPPVCLPEELGEVRTQELKTAAKIISIKQIFFLGLRDGTLTMFSLRFLANLIAPILIREKPDLVITFAKTGISGHDDHIVISKAATLAFKRYVKAIKHKAKLYYTTLPQSMVEEMRKKGMIKDVFRRTFQGTPDKEITIKRDIRDTLQTKIKALMSHKTQNKDWQRYLKRMKNGYSNYEYFVLAGTSLKKRRKKEKDLFEGL